MARPECLDVGEIVEGSIAGIADALEQDDRDFTKEQIIAALRTVAPLIAAHARGDSPGPSLRIVTEED